MFDNLGSRCGDDDKIEEEGRHFAARVASSARCYLPKISREEVYEVRAGNEAFNDIALT